MDVFEIPLTARPQTFQITLRGATYSWRLYWLVPADCWVVNIGDAAGNPIINGIPLLPGADLFGLTARPAGEGAGERASGTSSAKRSPCHRPRETVDDPAALPS